MLHPLSLPHRPPIPVPLQVSEVEVNGQIEQVCEQMFSEMESQAMDALDLPMPSCFRMRRNSYVRAMDQGCSEDDGMSLLPSSPPRTTTTTVRTIQSSTGQSVYHSSNTHGVVTGQSRSVALFIWRVKICTAQPYHCPW